MIGFEQGDCVGDEDDQRGDDPHVHLKQGTVGVVGVVVPHAGDEQVIQADEQATAKGQDVSNLMADHTNRCEAQTDAGQQEAGGFDVLLNLHDRGRSLFVKRTHRADEQEHQAKGHAGEPKEHLQCLHWAPPVNSSL